MMKLPSLSHLKQRTAALQVLPAMHAKLARSEVLVSASAAVVLCLGVAAMSWLAATSGAAAMTAWRTVESAGAKAPTIRVSQAPFSPKEYQALLDRTSMPPGVQAQVTSKGLRLSVRNIEHIEQLEKARDRLLRSMRVDFKVVELCTNACSGSAAAIVITATKTHFEK